MDPYASIAVFVHVFPKMASIITLQLLPFPSQAIIVLPVAFCLAGLFTYHDLIWPWQVTMTQDWRQI